MFKTLIIGIILAIFGLYLILNHKQYGKETMDWYRNFYRLIGMKRMVKTVTKEDDIAESKQGLICGIIFILLGIYGIMTFLHYHLTN